MMLSIIAALDDRGGIGRGGRLPWYLSTDLKRFKALTMGHHLIMGRKTFRSIGKALPGRVNIVVTRQADYHVEGIIVVHSLQEALDLAGQNGETEVFIIGGGEIFHQALPLADRLYLTHVHMDSAADVYFPEVDNHWKVTYSEEFPADEKNEYPTTFRIYART